MAEPAARGDVYVGVDLGGTKILAGVFDAKLNLLGTYKMSTKASRGPEGVIERIVRCVEDVIDECDLKKEQIKAIAVGAPGSVDSAKGTVMFAPNLEWKDVPLAVELAEVMKKPVFLENDCTVSMLGVQEVELKNEPANVVGIFVGTGVGGGLVIRGEIYRGATGCAGEIGHMVIDINGPKCGCGNRGCLEALASRNALFQRIRTAVKAGEETLLVEMLGKDLADMRSGDLRKVIRRGDKLVSRVVEEAAGYLGVAVSNIANLLGPQVIVLGGGVIEALQDEMMPRIIREAKEHAMPGALKDVRIVASSLGDHAGITGAAVIARRNVSR